VKVHTDRVALRLAATIIALGWAGAGAFSISMRDVAPSADLAGRALWMGITFLIAAGVALPVSWLVKDLSNIWCVPAKKTPLQRLDGANKNNRRKRDG